MKKFIFIISLLGNAALLYRLNENKKSIYDLTEREHFYRQKFNEHTDNY